MIVFLVLAVLGFVASVAVHVSTFFGSHAVGMSHAWPLHIGMFVVLLPVFVRDQRGRAGADEKRRSSHGQSRSVPRWMGVLLGACVVYTFVTVALLFGGEDAAREARAFSAIWMVAYAVAVAGVYEGLARRRAARAALPAFPTLPASIRHTNSYERAPAPRMSPWAHATAGAILSLVGFFVLPMVVGALFLAAKPSGGAWIFVLAPPFFAAAIVGMRLPGMLMSRCVAAACPACGGRAYADGGPLRQDDRPVRYTCRDCGRVSQTDGSEVQLPPMNHGIA